jgi:hypothetical protein
MGGIGKTELALQYAWKHWNLGTYPAGVCWLQAGDEFELQERLGQGIVQFARSKLDLKPKGKTTLERVEWCWSHWSAGETLLIFDDVQSLADIEPFLQVLEPRFKILLTTRLKLGTSIQQIDLSEFSEEQALELLRTIVKDGRVDQQLEDAKQLCQWLGYLPLALELIANYLAQEPYTNLNEMLGKLQREGLEDKALEIGERENQTQFA